MGQIKWYKRDPSAALNGMMELDLQERGAYNTVLDLIYSRDGNLPDDDRFISGWLRVDVRVWKRIKTTLISRGKLYVESGFIRNSRADVEVLAALSRVTSAQEAGLASARSKASKSDGKAYENSNLASTTVATGVSTTVSTNHNHNQIEEEPNGSPSRDRARKKSRADGSNERADDINPRSTNRNPRSAKIPDTSLPEWLPSESWSAFLAMRAKKRAAPTEYAMSLLIGKLSQLRDQGHDPGKVLDQSTLKNWTDLYPIKDDTDGNRNRQADGGSAAGYRGSIDRRDGFTRALHEELERTGSIPPASQAGRWDDGEAARTGELPIAHPPALR